MNTALNRTEVAYLQNKSGVLLAQGAVVIVSPANVSAFTTTTTPSYSNGMIGVVLEPAGIANNAYGAIALSGYVPKINLSSSASLGDLFSTHTVAGQAACHAVPVITGDFGMVLGTGASPAAILYGMPSQIAAVASYYAPTGLTGATAASRYVGATASGAPASGTFAIGDYVIDRSGKIWVCTTAGTPGTWTQIGAAANSPIGLITIFPFGYSSKQGTFARLNSYLYYNTSNVNGDYLQFTTYLPAGTYTFTLVYSQGGNGGKLDMSLNGSNIVTGVDCYGGGNDLQSVTSGVVVGTGGFGKLIRITVNGKNASSSAYYSFWSSLSIHQTA